MIFQLLRIIYSVFKGDRFMTAKKILIYFLAIVMVFACSGVPSVVMAEDSADKMIVFNRGKHTVLDTGILTIYFF